MFENLVQLILVNSISYNHTLQQNKSLQFVSRPRRRKTTCVINEDSTVFSTIRRIKKKVYSVNARNRYCICVLSKM